MDKNSKKQLLIRLDNDVWSYLKHLSVDNQTSMAEIISRLIINYKNSLKNILTTNDIMIS